MTTALAKSSDSPRKLHEKLAMYANRVAHMKDAEKETVARGLRTAVSFGTGFGLGYARGRYDYTEVAGAPLAPIIAIGATLGGFLIGKGETAEQLLNLGNAASAVYGDDLGEQIGRDRKEKAGE